VIIPTHITIGTHRYSIHMLKQMPRKGIMGTVHYDLGTIQLATHSNTTNGRYSPTRVQETFWHEITHAILHDMGHHLYTNERFVTDFSSRLSKAITSAKFK
jgi:hypothetical protein